MIDFSGGVNWSFGTFYPFPVQDRMWWFTFAHPATGLPWTGTHAEYLEIVEANNPDAE